MIPTLVIDATDARVGRMVTHAAKAALQGKKVIIVNCEEAIITGSKQNVVAKYTFRRQVGTKVKGPFMSRMPDRFVRRMVRSNLPYKTPHGREAFQRVQCYIGTPAEYSGKGVQLENFPSERRVKVGELCTLLGGKVE